jgi:hypothetical protein
MPFQAGDRVRLIKPVDIDKAAGPTVGAVGTVKTLAVAGAGASHRIWRVLFDDFVGEFRAGFPPGLWFVSSDEIELI